MREPVVNADSTTTDLREVVHNLMPALRRELTELVKIESVNAPTTISEVTKARAAIIDLFREAGITQARELVLEHEGKKTTPLVYADHPGPPGAPVVLLYAHYDVQPGGEGWTVTSPFTPLERDVDGDTRLYGRGAADDKSGVCLHLAAVRAFTTLPVHLKLVFEGEEEIGTGVLEDYLLANPTDDRFKADLIVVADTGNVRCGEPTLTVSLRGLVAVDVTVSTLDRPVHSGVYGGPAPDAFMALVRMLATLQDHVGDVAVAGLAKDTMSWPVVTEPQFRADAGVLPSVTLIGTDSIEERLYGKPSINVVGLDGVPPMSKATNALSPKATARISMRLAPSQDPDTARALLVNHLRHVAPWGVTVEITPAGEGFGFSAQTNGAYFTTAQNAIKTAYGADMVAHAGQGGSIPLVHAFQVVNPTADIVLWGCEEPRSAIHGPDESVSYHELESMALTETLLLQGISKELNCSEGSQ
jgi:acetylornithine deacetylase/succinyl-diaminopimelate desuccinylase-like protein